MKIKITVLFYILYITSFVRVVAVEYLPELKEYLSVLNFFCDFSILVLGISFISESPKKIAFVCGAFILISSVNFILNTNYEYMSHINGLRDFLNILSLFVIYNAIFNSSYLYYFNDLFKRFAHIFLFIQIPTAVLQYVNAGFVAGDHVGGTYSVGGSGLLTLSIFILVMYLIENKVYADFYRKMIYLFSISFFFLPIFINETKISFLLIPLLFLSLLEYKNGKSIFFGLLMGYVLFVFFVYLYSDRRESFQNPVTEIFNVDFLENYLAGEEQLNEDVPRFTKIAFSVQMAVDENALLFFGHEYGAFKGGTSLDRSAFSEKYQWLLEGTIPYFFYIFVSGGLTLVVLFFLLFLTQISIKLPSIESKYSKSLFFFLCSLFLLILFYNDAFRTLPFLIVFIYTFFYSLYYKPCIN